MRILDLRGADSKDAAKALPRPKVDISAALKVVEPIMEQVRTEGSVALHQLDLRFDGVDPKSLRVPQSALDAALAAQPPELTAALEVSIRNARVGHEAQVPTETVTEVVPGGFIYQRWVPINRVGLYVPGGLAVYPSSVVMNVIPALVAGVDSLVVASPPQKEFGGLPHPTILAACAMLGVKEVIAVGGAQAIAAMAYGFTEGDYTCQPVDKVTGPGNIYVAAAKRAVQGVCGIDSEAGTTEIAILADATANPDFVAADLISQAEHDPAAAAVLVTDSEDLAARVAKSLESQVANAPHKERIGQALAGPQSAIVLAEDLDQATQIVEAYGPEHLEVVTADALARSMSIKNAGAIFVGDYAPVPLGDYVSGSNHVLPTGGTSRFSSGLNTTTFLRSVEVIDYSREALDSVTDPLVTLAEAEGLPSHGAAAKLRREHNVLKEGDEGESISLPVREDLRQVEPYGAPQLDVPVRLNVNENPHAPSDSVVNAIGEAARNAASRLNRYADRDAYELRAALAKYVSEETGVDVHTDQVWAANGSNEIMIQLLQAFGGPGRMALALWPTYSMYKEYARDTNTGWLLVGEDDPEGASVDALITAMQEHCPAVVFVPSPNNPTGTAVPIEDLQQILDAARSTGPVRRFNLPPEGDSGRTTPPPPASGEPATLVVVDEAYSEFRDPGTPSALELLDDNPHLVVTRTMSKAFAAAGLRVGYMVASPKILEEVLKVRLPYHLSLLTQAAALAALDQADAQLAQVQQIRERREYVAGRLREMGLNVFPSASNFLLFGPFENPEGTWQTLLDQGVLIRHVGPAGHLRVTVGTETENELFLSALEETL